MHLFHMCGLSAGSNRKIIASLSDVSYLSNSYMSMSGNKMEGKEVFGHGLGTYGSL